MYVREVRCLVSRSRARHHHHHLVNRRWALFVFYAGQIFIISNNQTLRFRHHYRQEILTFEKSAINNPRRFFCKHWRKSPIAVGFCTIGIRFHIRYNFHYIMFIHRPTVRMKESVMEIKQTEMMMNAIQGDRVWLIAPLATSFLLQSAFQFSSPHSYLHLISFSRI